MRIPRFKPLWLAPAALLCSAGAALAQPANDLCASAQVIPATSLPVSVNAAGDLTDAGPTTTISPAVCVSSSRDVFFSFTPTDSANYTLTTCNSVTGSLDTVLSIHSACPGDGSTLVTGLCNDDGCTGSAGPSTITSAALNAGTTYIIRVARWNTGAGGPFRLDILTESFGACCDLAAGTCLLQTQASCASPNVFNGSATCTTSLCQGACCDPTSGACTLTGSTGCPSPNVFTTGGACSPNPCPQPPAPSNDSCFSATVASVGSNSGNAGGSTNDGASSCQSSAGRDVWWSFTPASSSLYQIDTCGGTPDWDTVLSVHTGCPGDTSNQISGACADQGCGTGNLSRIASVSLSAGTTYVIRLGGWSTSVTPNAYTLNINAVVGGACCNNTTGVCTLTVSTGCSATTSTYQGDNSVCSPNPCPPPPPPPSNDTCAGALNITAVPYTSPTINLALATSDQDVTCNSTLASVTNNGVWFTYTAAANGALALNNTTGPDTVTAIFTGSCGSLTQVACSDPSSFNYPTATAGTTYYILVGLWSSAATTTNPNNLVFTLDATSVGACCNNNTGVCTTTTAAGCSATTSTYQGDNTVCTPSPCAPTGACCATSGTCSVTTTAGCTGFSTFQGLGTVCSPNPCPQPIVCCFPSGVCVFVPPASCASASGTPDASGATSCAPSPCAGAINNYSCAAAVALPANTWRLGNNSNSTATSAAPAATCQSNSRREAWFTFTPTLTDSSYTITTCGSPQDTVIQLFTVGDCNNTATWTAVACDDDTCAGGEPTLIPLSVGAGTASLLANQTLNAGTTYHIRLTSYGTAATGGNYQIRVDNPNVGGSNVVCCRGATCAVIPSDQCTLSGPASGTQAVARPSQSSCTSNSFAGCCFADYDKSGTRTIDDIFIYLNGWFANSPYTKVGGDGTGSRTIDDIFLFLNAWFAGCN